MGLPRISNAPTSATGAEAILDLRYVLKAGDTMTGNLVISNAGTPELDFTKSGYIAQIFNDGNFHINGNGQNTWIDGGNVYMNVGSGGSVGIGTSSPNSNAGVTVNKALLISSKTSLTDGAAAQIATLTNAPTAGNPTKWIPIDDNGVTRYIPVW